MGVEVDEASPGVHAGKTGVKGGEAPLTTEPAMQAFVGAAMNSSPFADALGRLPFPISQNGTRGEYLGKLLPPKASRLSHERLPQFADLLRERNEQLQINVNLFARWWLGDCGVTGLVPRYPQNGLNSRQMRT